MVNPPQLLERISASANLNLAYAGSRVIKGVQASIDSTSQPLSESSDKATMGSNCASLYWTAVINLNPFWVWKFPNLVVA